MAKTIHMAKVMRKVPGIIILKYSFRAFAVASSLSQKPLEKGLSMAWTPSGFRSNSVSSWTVLVCADPLPVCGVGPATGRDGDVSKGPLFSFADAMSADSRSNHDLLMKSIKADRADLTKASQYLIIDHDDITPRALVH